MAGISILPYETIPTGKHNIANKQDKLVSGENIKTINNQSILGEGNLNIKSSENPDLNSPIDFGDAEHSAVLKGETNVAGVTYKNDALNEGCVSLGANSKAGLKGYYFTFIDFDTNQIWLHNKQFTSRLLGKYGGWTQNSVSDLNRCGWAKGDVISFTCNGHYDNSATIDDVNGNVITVDNIPFTSNDVPNTISSSLGELIGVNINNKFDECSVFCVKKYNIGSVELGGNAFAIGTNTQASNAVAYAEGYNTVAYGKYSHAEGNETEAGYNAHAEGYLTKAIGHRSHAEGQETQSIGDRSHAEGKETIANGNNSHAEGYKTKANGAASHAEGESNSTEAVCSHVEGYSNRIYKDTTDSSHAEGEYNVVNPGAYASHVEGEYNQVNNRAEHASGQYNKSTKSDVKSEATHFSIGIGTSVNDRKNALEVKQDGKVYIKGIGNYGVVTSDVVDLATVIISLQQEIEQLKTQLKTE